MGVLARILMFPSVQRKLEAFSKLDSLAKEGAEFEYGSIHLYNEKYGLDVKIKLLFKALKQGRLQSGDLSDIYIIPLDVPVEHESLEGKFDVKERREVYLVHFVDPQLENLAVISTEHGSKTLSQALKALQKIAFTPLESYIELPSGSKGIKVLKELGDIGWVYVDEIPDAHLKGAGLHGTKLQYSEILEDLTSRGGKIKAAVIHHSQRDVKIIVSERGSIYSQQNIDIVTIARILKDIIPIMNKHGLIRKRS
jgi:hypothetical protein